MTDFRVCETKAGDFVVQANAIGCWRQNGPNERTFAEAKERADRLQLEADASVARRAVYYARPRTWNRWAGGGFG